MSDLVCQSCGTAATYADALIADRDHSCDGDLHDWVRPMNNRVDIVTG